VDANEPANAAQWLALLAWWVLVLTVPASFALALWFRRRYVRAVVRLQSQTAAMQSGEPAARSGPPPSAPKNLTITVSDAVGVAEHAATRSALRLRRRVLRAQFVSGLFFWWGILICIYGAIPQAAASAAPDSPILPWLGWLLLFAPAVVAWAVQGGISNRVIWFAAAALGGILSIAFAAYATDWLVGGLGIAFVALLALMGAAILGPSARGAGPSLMAAFSQGSMVLVGLCAIFVLGVPERADATTAENILAATFLLTALGLAMSVSWHALHRIARSYESKRCSELQVALNGYWNLIALAGFAIALSMSLSLPGAAAGDAPIWAGLAVLVCYIAFRLVLRTWLRIVVRRAGAPLGPLLLLRVFKGSSASEAFMDRFLAYWRFAAPVWMIGGPDLAGAQMEPRQFFAFLRRRLDWLFVQSSVEISERVRQPDSERDPDARLRISELFCSNSTWQGTVLALLARAAVVILDLREYTVAHAGTRYEIFEIMNIAPIEKLIVLIGVRDNEQVIVTELRTAWNAMHETSPNRRATAPAIRVLRFHANRGAEIRGLFAVAASLASA
jgi:hypothetical protein